MIMSANKPLSGSQWSEVELVPGGTLKRTDHVKVALIERVDG
jgi:hypothetical protein